MTHAVVLFAASFKAPSSPNIDHISVDGRRTLCGRSGWAVNDGPDARLCGPDPMGVACRTCNRRWAVLAQGGVSIPDTRPDP